jgi:hypothetical protein
VNRALISDIVIQAQKQSIANERRRDRQCCGGIASTAAAVMAEKNRLFNIQCSSRILHFFRAAENFMEKTHETEARPDPVSNMRTFHSLVNLDSCQILSINYWSGGSDESTSLIQQKPAIRSQLFPLIISFPPKDWENGKWENSLTPMNVVHSFSS